MDEVKTSQSREQRLFSIINSLIVAVMLLVAGLVALPVMLLHKGDGRGLETGKPDASIPKNTENKKENFWRPADINAVQDESLKKKLAYGKELVMHTSRYLGPNGSVAKISNGMNCQNCHLEAGTKIFGNNYGSVSTTYPKFRPRSGTIENIYKRVNDCIMRSLNGHELDSLSDEMQSIAAYINFIGSNVEKGKKAEGAGLKDLAYLDRAADPKQGETTYTIKCQRCHQSNGEGLMANDGSEYLYPPLWGAHSFNDAAGLYRIGSFARFVKCNMPQGVSHDNTELTDEESWDVAAYVVSRPRPHLAVPKDWPDKSKKPIDHPFGPFADPFPETVHKYGPFNTIAALMKKSEAAKTTPKE